MSEPTEEPAKKTEAIEGKPVVVRDATAEELATLDELAKAPLGGKQEAINPQGEEIEEWGAEREAELEKYREFEAGVKFITGEKRFDRAMPWFRRFVRSRSESEEEFIAAITRARENGFTTGQLDSLPKAFARWKLEEKSRMARESRSARKKKE